MCEGDSVSFSVTNVSIPASYYWSTGSSSSVTTISPSTGITVATTLTSSQGCSNSKYLIYTPIPRTAILSIIENSKTICLGQSVNFNASYNNIVALGWSTGDSTASIYVMPTITTTYSLIGQDIYGCKYQDNRIVTVDPCTDVNEYSVNSELWIFPNPSREFFEVRSNSQQDIKLFDAQAKLIFSTTLSADNKYRALIDNLPTGVYFLKTNNETFKLLKMQ
jgi:hypothetical protein